MFYKISTLVLCGILVLGTIFWYKSFHQQIKIDQSTQTVTVGLTDKDNDLKQKMDELQKKLNSSQQEVTGLRRNLADLLPKF